QAFLRARLREARIDFKWHHVESSFLEAVFTLGGREVGAAIALGQQRGCRFDGWTEQLKFETWMEALEDAGVDPFAIANRPRGLDESLPWDHIDCGVSKQFLTREPPSPTGRAAWTSRCRGTTSTAGSPSSS
ncbi:MAG: B12-binding domain-containing radical SAM protein, partial [candidate division NC10 bacterium]|nr:B12-binding domain-containing radical SAM protein [candidate division NC10 bacterium]